MALLLATLVPLMYLFQSQNFVVTKLLQYRASMVMSRCRGVRAACRQKRRLYIIR